MTPPFDARDAATLVVFAIAWLVAVIAGRLTRAERCTRLDCAECRRAARRLWGLS